MSSGLARYQSFLGLFPLLFQAKLGPMYQEIRYEAPIKSDPLRTSANWKCLQTLTFPTPPHKVLQ